MPKFPGESQNLTPQAVRDFPMTVEGQRIYWDSNIKGFGVLVGKHTKTFIVQRTVRGKTVRVTLGRFGPHDLTVPQARRLAEQRVADLGKGIRAPSKSITLRYVWESLYIPWLRKAHRAQSTQAVYERQIRYHFSDWMDRPLADITREDVVQRHEDVTKNVGAPSADLAFKIFRAVYGRALKVHANLPANPVVAIDFNRVKTNATPIEASNLVAWYNVARNTPQADLLLFLLYSGLRKSSAMNIAWDDVDLDARVLRVRVAKGNKPFALPLSRQLIEILKRQEHLGEWVWPSATSRSGHTVVVSVPAVEGLDWSPHDLRRTFISQAVGINVNRFALKTLVNHAPPKGDVTDGYTKLDTEQLRDAIQRINDKLTSIIDGGATVTPIRRRA